jgi:putative MFS transporter
VGTGGSASAESAVISGRLDRLRMSWPIWLLIGQLSFTFFFELYDIFQVGYIAPGIVRAGILTTTTRGLFGLTGIAAFVAALFGGLSIGTFSSGFLADRLGRRRVFLSALLWFAIAEAVMAFQRTASSLDIMNFVVGLGLGVELVTTDTYISEIVPKEVRGRAFAFNQTLGFCAVPAVAFLSWYFVPRTFVGIDGWRWVVLLGALGALVAFGLALSLPESPRWLAARGRLEDADRVVSELERRVERATGEAPADALPSSATIPPAGRFSEIWRPPFRSPTIMLAVFNVFQTVGFYGFVNWAPSILVARGMTIVASLMYLSVIALASPMGPLLGMLFADRFERKHMIMFSAAAIAIFGLVFGYARSAPLVIAAGVGITLCQNILSFSYHAYQAEIYPTSIRAKAVGFVYSWSRVSAMVSAFIIAYVLRFSGVIGVFVFIALAMVVVVGVIGAFGPRSTGLSVEGVLPHD